MKSNELQQVFIALAACLCATSMKSQSPNFDWTVTGGRGRYAGAYGVIVDSAGDLIVSGGATDTLSLGGRTLSGAGLYGLLAKLTARGNVVWLDALQVGPADQRWGVAGQRDIALDPHGNMYVCGSFGGTMSLQGTTIRSQEEDGYVAKFDASGRLLWLRSVSGDGNESATSLAIDRAGNCCVTGEIFTPGTRRSLLRPWNRSRHRR